MVNAYFLDTSALVKFYVTEAGSEWIRLLIDSPPKNKIILSRITWIETLSAFSRLQRESRIDSLPFDLAIEMFKFDWQTRYEIVEFNTILAEQAGELVRKHPLRAYDSIQLASALRFCRMDKKNQSALFTFVSADDQLLRAAGIEGMRIDNPLKHSNQ
jgi:uncharacterized protein